MNPIVLAVLIVGGLVLIDILLRYAGNRAGGQLASEADAIEQFRREYSEIEASELADVVLTADRRAAFVAVASGETGFVYGLGDRFIVRRLRPDDIADLLRESEKALKIRFREVTLRPMRFEFANAAARDFVLQSLSADRPRLK